MNRTLLLPLLLCLSSSAFAAAKAPAADDDELGPALVDLRASTRPFTLSAGADERYDRGIAHMYRVEFDRSEVEFREIVARSPDDPAGYFALAALAWWRYSQNFDQQGGLDAVEKDFMENADRAIELSKRLIKEGRDLDQAYFFMGSAYGLQGRWYAVKRSWWRAYTHGRKGRKYLKKCVEENPAVYDAYLGLGIFDYYAATLPGALGLGAKLFVGGDRLRGIEYVKVARDKGRFFKLEARFFLIEIYSMHEDDFKAAYAEVEALKALDPTNMLFRIGEIMTHIQARDWAGVLSESESFLGAWQVKPQKGLEGQLAMVYLSGGDALIAMKRYEAAAEWFTTGIERTCCPDKGWVTYCYLRRAQALDLLGRRLDALADYRRAADRPNFWDSKKYAKAGLKAAPDHVEVYRQLITD